MSDGPIRTSVAALTGQMGTTRAADPMANLLPAAEQDAWLIARVSGP